MIAFLEASRNLPVSQGDARDALRGRRAPLEVAGAGLGGAVSWPGLVRC
jgi:hypothetical protein